MPHAFAQHAAAALALRHLWASEVNAEAVALLAPGSGERVVDLGSGLGPATVLLRDAVGPSGTVTAVDPTRSLRAALRLRTRFGPRPHPRVVAGSAESLPLGGACVDAVFSLNAMHHWDDLASAAEELRRVLRPGGRVLLVDEDFDHEDHSMHDAGGPSHHGMEAVDPEAVAALLRGAGFAEASGRRAVLGGEPALVVQARR